MANKQTLLNARDFGRKLPQLPDPRSADPYDIRQRILLETLDAFEACSATRRFHETAQSNLSRWHGEARARDAAAADDGRRDGGKVIVAPGDWGEVTLRLTKEYGATFAALNMANAYVPGGGYVEGCPAQEENMFRRTDCHFSIDRNDREKVRIMSGDLFASDIEYTPHMTSLLSGKDGLVYLDVRNPRVCIRGVEDRSRDDLGYAFLPDDEIFPFYELRAAALDLRRGRPFDAHEMRRRIKAQLDTLKNAGVRHAVLSAFGCGAFRNPAKEVAELYRDEIAQRVADFDVLAFAIFHPGYGPNNFAYFEEVFRDFGAVKGLLVD